MLHGLLVGSIATWYLTAAPALAKQHEVFMYDLRGHGRSARELVGYDLATASQDLAALLERYDAPVSLVGHSFGGLIALHFALEHPRRVERLALVDIPLPPTQMEGFHQLSEIDPSDVLSGLPEPLSSAVARGGRQARRLWEALSFLLGQSSLLNDIRSASDIPDAELARIPIPVLCLFGSKSRCLPTGERLARIIPKATLEVLDGGHYLPLEARDAVTQRLVEFLHG